MSENADRWGEGEERFLCDWGHGRGPQQSSAVLRGVKECRRGRVWLELWPEVVEEEWVVFAAVGRRLRGNFLIARWPISAGPRLPPNPAAT